MAGRKRNTAFCFLSDDSGSWESPERKLRNRQNHHQSLQRSPWQMENHWRREGKQEVQFQFCLWSPKSSHWKQCTTALPVLNIKWQLRQVHLFNRPYLQYLISQSQSSNSVHLGMQTWTNDLLKFKPSITMGKKGDFEHGVIVGSRQSNLETAGIFQWNSL